MPTHKVMDHTGHSETAWDKSDQVSVAEAEKRFAELTKKGFIAFEPGPNGEPGRLLKGFDPEAETTVFHASLQGG